mgnify:CR=1 FL=1
MAAFDAGQAYQLALRWKISGDTQCADKAVQILNDWARTCTDGVNQTQYQTDSHRLLAAGFIGYQFANPAEIMRDYEGWKKEDFEFFKEWITKTFYPICYEFLGDHFNSAPEDGWMRFVMLRRLMPMVDRLCSMAEVAGCRMPRAPSAMRVELKLSTKR